jgi:archaellum component FlaC
MSVKDTSNIEVRHHNKTYSLEELFDAPEKGISKKLAEEIDEMIDSKTADLQEQINDLKSEIEALKDGVKATK